MSDDHFFGPIDCVCTNPVHGGKLWKCDTEACYLNKGKEPDVMNEDHPVTCCCEVCRFWS